MLERIEGTTVVKVGNIRGESYIRVCSLCLNAILLEGGIEICKGTDHRLLKIREGTNDHK